MRSLISFSVAAAVWFTPSVGHADPAYTARSVIDIFVKEKQVEKNGAPRRMCVGTAAECRTPPPKPFDLLVAFEFDSDKLTKAATENLDEFAKALRDPRLEGERFEIDGHTDATGTPNYNQSLSERRAEAVVSYLVSQGVDASRFVSKGFGKTKPRVSNPFSPENRRVETHLLQ
jgi:outer membrane protein OmpA-like peptidoglycan-associated protein